MVLNLRWLTPCRGLREPRRRTYLGAGVEGFGRVVSSCGHGNNVTTGGGRALQGVGGHLFPRAAAF
ncbi:MAG: hypothetical protein ACLTDR_03120 [Adlercreutzia equolifaciens]